MPKSPSRSNSSSNVQDDEGRVLETLRSRPEVFDALNKASNKKQQNADFEEIAGSLNCTADALKKAWLKRNVLDETKKSKKPTSETRPRSARSSSIGPREARRSLRSQSIDKTLVAASTILLDSTDNSCASSSCGSPRPGDNRPHQRTTRRNLVAINEDSVNISDVTITPLANLGSNARGKQKEKDNKPKTKGKEKIEVVEDSGSSSSNNNNNVDDYDNNRETVNDQHNQEQQQQQPADNDELTDASTTALHKFLEAKLSENKSRSLRFSEPPGANLQTPCNSRSSIGANASRRLSVVTATASTMAAANEKTTRASTGIGMLNPEDPTRVFFESMGLTVMSFPQHLQASIKAQVSNIVHQLEYDLFSPLTKGITEKTVAVAS